MVRKLFVLTICTLLLITGCNVDWLGLVYSSDLDERLVEQNNFRFIKTNDYDWTTLSLPDSYSFVVLSDTHIENKNDWGLENLAGIIAANDKIKFAVILGDITQYGSAQDINRFIEITGQMGVPCYPVIGNHDLYYGNFSVWKNRIGSTRYRIDGDNITLFILDTGNSFFGKQQLDWLENELRYTNGRVFVFTHVPLFVNCPIGIHQITDYRERSRIISILQGKCDIMFMGHSHNRLITEVGGVKYINIEDFVGTKTYCIVTVDPSGVNYSFHKL